MQSHIYLYPQPNMPPPLSDIDVLIIDNKTEIATPAATEAEL